MQRTAPKASPKDVLRFAQKLAETCADLDSPEETRHAAGSALSAMIVYGDVIELALRRRLRCVQQSGTAA